MSRARYTGSEATSLGLGSITRTPLTCPARSAPPVTKPARWLDFDRDDHPQGPAGATLRSRATESKRCREEKHQTESLSDDRNDLSFSPFPHRVLQFPS